MESVGASLPDSAVLLLIVIQACVEKRKRMKLFPEQQQKQATKLVHLHQMGYQHLCRGKQKSDSALGIAPVQAAVAN